LSTDPVPAAASGDVEDGDRVTLDSLRRVAGRYRVEALLGKGGMASVYRVFDESSGRPVALKRATAALGTKRDALFEREYHTLAGLRHPRIIEVYEYGVDGDTPYYTMELLEGEDLRELAPMPWRQACAYLRDVATSLALLHAQRLVHRDIAPRNVWRTRDGRCKLIDFGALMPFGTARELVGTPAYMPPEALYNMPLDQRADLYALGALAYWMVTGRNAFRASRLADLPFVWERKPELPSALVRAARQMDPRLEDLPEALDELILSLLNRDALGRPASAAEVIDRLNALAGLEAEESLQAAESYLASTAFVGRAPELELMRKTLEHACSGKGASVLVESAPGMGKSRLVVHFGLTAQLEGATLVRVEARLHSTRFGVARAIALRLFDLLPDAALEAARPYAEPLGWLSPDLYRRVAGSDAPALAPVPRAVGEARMRIQSALQDWVLELSQVRPLVLAVDDLEASDESSAGVLAVLSHRAPKHRLLVVGTIESSKARQAGPVLQTLMRNSERVELKSLTFDETKALVRSTFGDVLHLARLSQHLYTLCNGNPRHCLELINHLVREDIVRHVEGTWLLPQELSAARLPATFNDALAARLRPLGQEARALGRLLSVHTGALPVELPFAVARSSSRQEVSWALDELLREAVLVSSGEAYHFSRDEMRVMLAAELEPEAARVAHRHFGEALLESAQENAVKMLEAGLHLFRGGDERRGSELITRAGVQLTLVEADSLQSAIPALEEIVQLYKSRGRPRFELIAPLAPLASAAYYADRQLAPKYGDETLLILREALGLARAEKLRRWLGSKLGLIVGLVGGMIGLRRLSKSGRVPTFRETFALFFNSVATLTGVYTISIDFETAQRYARLLEPLRSLGKNHVASFMADYCRNIALMLTDEFVDVRDRWLSLLDRLQSSEPVRDLPVDTLPLYLGGGLYACGILESWRDGPSALEFAARLDRMGMKLYEMAADQIRMQYYANQGDVKLAEHYRDRVEMHAIQRGTAWQVELWGISTAITIHLRTGDALGMKRAAKQLEKLCNEIPSLTVYVSRARGAHLLLRGKVEEALEPLEQGLGLQHYVGWTRGMGTLARAYNELGRHAEAKDTCLRALAATKPENQDFVAMNLIVQIELALADAGLGNHAAATELLDALIERHSKNQGPLTLGSLHHARARVALLAGDLDAFEEHRLKLDGWYRLTENPALVAQCDILVQQAERAAVHGYGAPAVFGHGTGKVGGVGHLFVACKTPRERADLALELIAGRANSKSGYLFRVEGLAASLVATLNADAPCRELLGAVSGRVTESAGGGATVVTEEALSTRQDAAVLETSAGRYAMFPLYSLGAGDQPWSALAVLAVEDATLPMLKYEFLEAIAAELATPLQFSARAVHAQN
jgi:serine/threonine-protein kinase